MKTVLRRTAILIGSVIALYILSWVGTIIIAANGGVPWANHQAQQRMIQLLKTKYPNKPFRVTHQTYWGIIGDEYVIGVVFSEKPAEEFLFFMKPKSDWQMYWFNPSPNDELIDHVAVSAPGVNRTVSPYDSP